MDVGHSKDNKHEDGEEPGKPEHAEQASEAVDPAESDNEPDIQDEPAETPPRDRKSAKKAKKAKKKQMPFWKELLMLAGIAIVLAILIQSFIARVFLIPSESMERTLHGCSGCYGDRVVVDRVTYLFSDPEPGDVVVFQRPDTWNRSEFQANRSSNPVFSWLQDLLATFGLAEPNEDDVVKRVIAVGGQTVECCDSQGRVQVNGRPLDEPYVHWAEGVPNGNQEFPSFRVPEGTLWVMGDNRNNSADSRVQGGGGINGVVPVDNVIGKARFIVLPPSRWQGIGDHNPQLAVAWAGAQFGLALLGAVPTLWLGRRLRASLRSHQPGRRS